MSDLKKLLDKIELTILNIEYYTAGSNWNYRNVNNPYSRIYLITEGYAQINMHNKQIKLRPNWLYLLPCFTTIDMCCTKYFSQYYIHFTSRLQTGLDILSILKCNEQISAKKHKIDRELFDRLLELNPNRELFEYDANKPIYKRVTERAAMLDAKKSAAEILESDGLMRILLSAFFADCDNSEVSETVSALGRFSEVLEYVRQNLDSQLSIDKLARIANLNPTYFSNLFSKLMGISPVQYINRRRIEMAQRLLLSKNESLQSIASKVGIDDVFYFSRLFKKITHIPPAKYRKQHIPS